MTGRYDTELLHEAYAKLGEELEGERRTHDATRRQLAEARRQWELWEAMARELQANLLSLGDPGYFAMTPTLAESSTLIREGWTIPDADEAHLAPEERA